MATLSDEEVQEKLRGSIRKGTGIAGFITAVILVLVVCRLFNIEIRMVVIALAIVIGLVVGIPLFVFSVRENTDGKDEKETCEPILKKYWTSRSTKDLIADYDEWTKGNHSSYNRVHFGGDIVGELQMAKEYEEALRILDELDGIQMKSRERYDYENYRDQVRPQLLEGIEKQKRQAEERARNKNLRKK